MGELKRPRLRLVRGGKQSARTGTVRVKVAVPNEAVRVDAVVLEEDTWLILSAQTEITEPADHPVRLLTELHEAQPLTPGMVLVREERPLTLLAIVYDFGAEPCCRHEWITDALAEVLRLSRERQIRSLLLPLLGVRHGKLKPEEILPLIARVFRAGAPGQLQSVLLAVPQGDAAEVGRLLAAGEGEEARE